MVNLAPYQALLDWIDSQSQHMVFLTEKWSNINSGSTNLAGLEAMRAALADNFMWLGGQMEILDLPPRRVVDRQGHACEMPVGKALRIRKYPEAKFQVFLGGHMDTVFPADHPFQKATYLDENRLNGPGVADLKGGLVVMLKALEALEQSPWAGKIGFEVLMNPDEEIGSQSSDFLLKEAAQRCHLGLVYEPALADGTLAGARKGSGNFTFVVRGRAAHAGRDFASGRNAIVAASELIAALYALNGKCGEVTLNIGQIEGGGAVNIVPDLAIVRLNVRTTCLKDEQRLEGEFGRIERSFAEKEGIRLERHGGFTRKAKPMAEENARLFHLVKECGGALGQAIDWKPSGGCCDGNNLWAHGLPNVDTLGVCGGNIHSDQEFVLLDSLPARAKLSALLLMRLASGEITFS